MRVTSFDKTELDVGIFGDGEPVILLHAFMLHAEQNWIETGVAQAIVDAGRQVVLIDARGHGDSDCPHDPARYADRAMARDVLSVMKTLDLHPADLVGYSMGAGQAVEVAMIESAKVRSLVLAGFSLYEPDWQWSAEDRRAEADNLREENPDHPGFYRQFADEEGGDRFAFAARIEGAEFPEYRIDDLSALPMQVTVINGEHDFDADVAAAPFPSGKAMTIPGDHISAIWESAFADAIVKSLTEPGSTHQGMELMAKDNRSARQQQ
ncbi:MAG: alpha/beta fold hydrolase [Phycisphaerae bacterium]